MAYESLRYVDHVGNNYLFRGGSPVTTDPNTGEPVFDYDGLMAAIASKPELPPTPLPSSYYLVDINLEHANESTNLTTEIDYFANNPNGQLVLWDTNGTPQCYWQTDPPKRAPLVVTLGEWLPDPLIGGSPPSEAGLKIHYCFHSSRSPIPSRPLSFPCIATAAAIAPAR